LRSAYLLSKEFVPLLWELYRLGEENKRCIGLVTQLFHLLRLCLHSDDFSIVVQSTLDYLSYRVLISPTCVPEGAKYQIRSVNPNNASVQGIPLSMPLLMV
jgi:hypothetical protein